MRRFQKLFLAAFVSFGIIGSHPVHAEEAAFSDVSNSYWGHADIQWAVDNDVTTGYPDGYFRPSRAITQNEWLAMLIRAYQPTDYQPDSSRSWDKAYVEYAAKMGWQVSSANPSLTRGIAAQLEANALGKNYSIDDSIQYLLDLGFSRGKTSKTIAGFGKQDPLTRAEAVSLIRRLKSESPNLRPSPATSQSYSRGDHVVIYQNDTFHFALTLPLSWKDKYEIEDQTRSEAPDLHNLNFKTKLDRTEVLFTVSIWPKEFWEENGKDISEQVSTIKKLGETKDSVYVFHLPTDVQYDPNDESDKQNFLSMYADVADIPETFEFIGQ